MRDHMRYVNELQCAAARVVASLRKRAREKDPSNAKGLFDTMHVRRGDFQYKGTRIDADKIYEATKKKLAEGATVYIATDERDKAFFKVLKDHYDVVFLDDFMDELKDVNTNYVSRPLLAYSNKVGLAISPRALLISKYGMLDQLIASRGRYFFGCWFSTFTVSQIRMRVMARLINCLTSR
jgi:hypothetical protein